MGADATDDFELVDGAMKRKTLSNAERWDYTEVDGTRTENVRDWGRKVRKLRTQEAKKKHKEKEKVRRQNKGEWMDPSARRLLARTAATIDGGDTTDG